MFKKLVLALLFPLLLLSVTPSVSFAQNASTENQMINMSLKQIATQGNTVSAQVVLANGSAKNFAQSYLIAKLYSAGGERTVKVNGQTITMSEPGQLISFGKSEPFSLTPSQSLEKPISVKYPPTIQSGKYKLMVELKDGDSTSQASSSQDIDLTGSGTFLQFSETNCQIKIGSAIYDTNEGPNIKNTDQAILSCNFQNPSPQTLRLKPQVFYAVNSLADATKVETLAVPSEIVVGPTQKGAVNINIPNNLPPQVYEGSLSFVDSGGQEVSSKVPFRWIMTGPSAVIKNLDLDKSYYKEGETAKVSVTVLPSVDLSWRGYNDSATPGFSPSQGTDLKNPKLTLKITGSDNQVCGQTEKTLPPTSEEISWEAMIEEVPISADCKNPQVEAAVYEQGINEPLKVLVKGMVTTPEDLGTAALKVDTKNPLIWVLLVVLIAAGVAGFLYWKKKKKSSPPSNPPSSTPPAKPVSAAAVIILAILGIYLAANNGLGLLGKPFIALAQFTPIQGNEKAPVNSSDSGTKTVTMKVSHDRDAAGNPIGPMPLSWANVRDFTQTGTGGDSSVTVSEDCRTINVTLNGTSDSEYMCANWGPGIAVASFIDGQAATPSAMTTAIPNNRIMIPSVDVTSPSAFNDRSAYGPHIFNVYSLGTVEPKNVTYRLTPNANLSEGFHKLLVQVGVAQTTIHTNVVNRFYSSLEHTNNNTTDVNCDNDRQPCYIKLEHEFRCGPPPACNAACSTNKDCVGNKDGCTNCIAGACRPTPACNIACERDDQCAGSKDGCTSCVSGTCRIPPACNVACQKDGDCTGAKDGCTSCLPSDTGSGTVCRPTPACNVACTKDGQCAGAKDGCTVCTGGVCKPPAACGTACTTKADCASATKDGCLECLEGTCSDFNKNMCKCDGIVADLEYPSSAFKFEAFGKVEGTDVKKAEIADITFRMTKNDGDVIAKSNPITPEIVENQPDKLRFKAAWQTPPPPVDKNATYRVFAEVRCKPKRIVASGAELATIDPNLKLKVASMQKPTLPVPMGLQMIANIINKIFGKGSDLITKEALAQFTVPTPTPNEPGSNLQLKTLNFIKMMETDNCTFIRWKFDETLF